MQEIWKDIEGYENLYAVSNLGRVKSLTRFVKNNVNGGQRQVQERVLIPTVHKQGYLYVYLWKDNKQDTRKVHRLVAEAFISNPENKPEVNHQDEIKTNNRVDNLQWFTSQENMTYGTMNSINRRKSSKLNKKIIQKDLNDNEIDRFNSIREAARQLNLDPSAIGRVCRGKQDTHGGFKFEYQLTSYDPTDNLPYPNE